MTFQRCKVGVLQLTVNDDKENNIKIATKLVNEAKDLGAEAFDFIGNSIKQSLELSEDLEGSIVQHFKAVAKSTNMWMSLGGMHRRNRSSDKIFNSHIILNNKGEIAGIYDKAHLFDSTETNIDSFSINESKLIHKGLKAPVSVLNTPVGNLELASSLRYINKVDVLTYPAAFSTVTGKSGHWHVLLRARAIENQCYVIAAAQVGEHNKRRSSYGHSLVIDPWGNVVAENMSDEPGVIVCDIFGSENSLKDQTSIVDARKFIPVEAHRRHDLFLLPDSGTKTIIGDNEFSFGTHVITPSTVFYRTELSYCFVNISPLVPGHVLVSPIAKKSRFVELSPSEIADLYLTVKHISDKIVPFFNATSLTISIQDGVDAGQSVPLQEHDKGPDRVFRSKEEMEKEAATFRNLF